MSRNAFAGHGVLFWADWLHLTTGQPRQGADEQQRSLPVLMPPHPVDSSRPEARQGHQIKKYMQQTMVQERT